MKVLIFLACSTAIPPSKVFSFKSFGNERIEEYVEGLKLFFKYSEFYKNNNIDILFSDNSILENKELDENIKNILPKNIIIKTYDKNVYGKINPGCGLIEQWTFCKDEIKQYNWIIHYEPRQLLQNNFFIENLVKNGFKNTFKITDNNTQFYTGFFCISSNLLLKYIGEINMEYMCKNSINIERSLFEFIKEYNNSENLGLLWRDNARNVLVKY